MDTDAVDFFYEKRSGDVSGTAFNATNNWWGADTFTLGPNVKAGDGNGFIDVDSYVNYTPYAGGPFIGYINGKDSNDNGFADLGDFYDQRAQGLNVSSGLNHGQWGKLDMAVQLDGPTTGNEYQGKTLGMDMTVNMNQH